MGRLWLERGTFRWFDPTGHLLGIVERICKRYLESQLPGWSQMIPTSWYSHSRADPHTRYQSWSFGPIACEKWWHVSSEIRWQKTAASVFGTLSLLISHSGGSKLPCCKHPYGDEELKLLASSQQGTDASCQKPCQGAWKFDSPVQPTQEITLVPDDILTTTSWKFLSQNHPH